MQLFKEAADIKTADQLHLPTPTPIYHNVVAQPTEIQKGMVQELSERAAKVHAGIVDASTDNMLKITSDGRKLGLDQRVINPDLPDEAGSKVNMCVDNIYSVWKDGQADKLTQLVFCDLSTPKAAMPASRAAKAAGGNLDSPELHALEAAVGQDAAEEPAFTIYDDIREKLVARGIPREQIAFIHEANTEARKKELFAKVRAGQVRVLMGSTFKMGAGMNVQDRLVALHDLDCPWRPGDLEQRSGRIIRQGNRNKEVHIYRYVTESTFDAYLWQTVENKQKFISQIMTSKSPVRSCEDVDETALSYAEIKALCAGDERIKEKMDLDVDVARLKLMKASHQSQQYKLEDSLLKKFPEDIEKSRGFISGLEADMKTLAAHPHPEDGFAGMTVKNDNLTDKDNAGAALLEAFKDVQGMEPVPVGTYRGFQMSLTLEDFGKDYVLTLDEYAADIVRDIFSWKLEGMSPQDIAARLNRNGVLSPMEYKKSLGMKFATSFKANPQALWSANAVLRILKNPVYTGVLIQGKETTPSYKVRKRVTKPENEWAVVPDTHEAIIERRDFDSVQKALSLDTRRSPGDSAVQLFSGMVFCGECGASMVRKTVPSGKKKYVYYVCAAHKQDKSCSPHRMRDEALEQLVLDTVKQYIRDVVDLDDILAMTDTAPLRTAEAQKVQRQLDKKRSEHERLQKLLMSLYESLADGIIDRDEYARLKQNYAGRCAECEKQMDALQETLTQIREHGGEHREWMAQFRKHLNITELERSIVVALIDRILIYRDNRVEVRFRFADEFAWQTDILRRSQIREVV